MLARAGARASAGSGRERRSVTKSDLSRMASPIGPSLTRVTALARQGAPLGTATPPSGPIRPDRDADLVAKLRGQAPGAVETLAARYGHVLLRLAVGITANEADAEEAVQDALWAAVRRIETFRHESAFSSWLYRIAANAAYGARRRRRHAGRELPWDEVWRDLTENGQRFEPSSDWSADVEQPAVQADLRRALAVAIDDLPADHRAAFWLREIEGRSNAETAKALGLSLPALKSRVHRSRLGLRKRLAGYMTGDGRVAKPARGAERRFGRSHGRARHRSWAEDIDHGEAGAGPRGPRGGER
jgi:RNA polymerase sigma-70 factor (ECF subfamily)